MESEPVHFKDPELVDAFRFEQAFGLLYSWVAISLLVMRCKLSPVWRRHASLTISNVIVVNVQLHLSSIYAYSDSSAMCSCFVIVALCCMMAIFVGGFLKYLDLWGMWNIEQRSYQYPSSWPQFLKSRNFGFVFFSLAAIQVGLTILGTLTRIAAPYSHETSLFLVRSSYELLGIGGFLVAAIVFTKFHLEFPTDPHQGVREIFLREAAISCFISFAGLLTRSDNIVDWWLPTQVLLWYPLWVGIGDDWSCNNSMIEYSTPAILLGWHIPKKLSVHYWVPTIFDRKRFHVSSLGDAAKISESASGDYAVCASFRNAQLKTTLVFRFDHTSFKNVIQCLSDEIFAECDMIRRDQAYLTGMNPAPKSALRLPVSKETGLHAVALKQPAQFVLTPLSSPKSRKSPESVVKPLSQHRKHSISLNRYSSPPRMSPLGHQRKHSVSLNQYAANGGNDLDIGDLKEDGKDLGAIAQQDYTKTFDTLRGKHPVQAFSFLRPADNYSKRKLFDKKQSVSTMLTWQKDPIPRSLFHLSTEYCGGDAKKSKRLKHEARDLFKVILGYMGDRKAPRDPVPLAQQITTRGADEPLLRDPIFLQLIKQTSGNPSEKSELLGWKLMYMCLKTFKWCEQELGVILVSHITEKANPKPDRFASFTNCHDAALKCYLQWRITNDAGPSTAPLTVQEICSLTEERGILLKIFIPNGTFEKISIPSNAVAMNIQDLQLDMVERLSLKGYDISTFEIRVQCENTWQKWSERIWMSPKTTIFECIAHWDKRSKEISNMRFSLLFRKRCFFESDLSPTKDTRNYVRLLYHQAVEDTRFDRYQLSLEVVARLLAIQLMVRYNAVAIDKQFLKKSNLLQKFIPEAYLQAWPIENWRTSVLAHSTTLSQEYDATGEIKTNQLHLLRLKYISLVSDQALYGCSQFLGDLRKPDIDKFKDKRVFLCVGWRDVHVVDNHWKHIATLPLESVQQVRIPKRREKATGYDEKVKFTATDMESGDTHDFEFLTHNAPGVKDLLKKIATAKLSKKMKKVAMAKLRQQRERRRGAQAHTRSHTLQSDLVAELVDKLSNSSKSTKKPKPKPYGSLPRALTTPECAPPVSARPRTKPQPKSVGRIKNHNLSGGTELDAEITSESLSQSRAPPMRGGHLRSNSARNLSRMKPGIERRMSMSLKGSQRKQDMMGKMYSGL